MKQNSNLKRPTFAKPMVGRRGSARVINNGKLRQGALALPPTFANPSSAVDQLRRVEAMVGRPALSTPNRPHP